MDVLPIIAPCYNEAAIPYFFPEIGYLDGAVSLDEAKAKLEENGTGGAPGRHWMKPEKKQRYLTIQKKKQ